MLEVKASQIELEVDGSRRQRKCAFNDGDRLVDTRHSGELAGEFLKGWQKWRSRHYRPAKQIDCFRTASNAAQCGAQQGFDAGITMALRRLFERRDCLPAAVLSEQGATQYRCGGGVGSAAFQDFRGELLCFGESLPLQCDRSAFEQMRTSSTVDR